MGTLARNSLILPCQILTLFLDPNQHSFHEHENAYF